MSQPSFADRLRVPEIQGRHLASIITLVDVLSILAFIAAGIAGLVVIVRYPPVVWVDLLFDDAYYYLGIVRNVVDHGVSVFLPPFSTNGYQPLWLALLSVSATIFGTSGTSLVMQSYLLGFVLVLAFGAVSKARYGAAFPAIAVAAYHEFATLAGMETTLVPILAVFYLTARKWTAQGAFGSLLFLARLDALSFVVAADMANLLSRKSVDFRKYLIVLPVVAMYLMFNWHYFGVPVPISGLAKSVGNVRGENFRVALAFYNSSRYLIDMFVGLVVALLVFKGALRFVYRTEILASVISLVMCVTYYTVNSGWPVWLWYFWPIMLVMYYVSLEMLAQVKAHVAPDSAPNGGVGIHVWVIGLAVLLFVAKPAFGFCMHRIVRLQQMVVQANDDPTFGRKNVELVEFLERAHTPPGTFFAMGDRAGSFGFFLGNRYRFIHTEGLVGPREYYDALVADRGEDFIDRLNLDYLVVDRERVMTDGAVLGIVEPVQPLSARTGNYVLCFPGTAIKLDQSFKDHARYLIDYHQKVACPASITGQFLALRQHYNGIKHFSFPTTEQ